MVVVEVALAFHLVYGFGGVVVHDRAGSVFHIETLGGFVQYITGVLKIGTGFVKRVFKLEVIPGDLGIDSAYSLELVLYILLLFNLQVFI